MSNLTEDQIKKLIEKNLTMKFRYDLDRMMDEKRPFGNSGFGQIQKDIMEIISEKKTWNVSDEDELDELRYKWMEECFKEVNDWRKNNRENFKIRLFANCEVSE